MFYENNENPILSFTAPNPSEDASESIDEELQKDTIDEEVYDAYDPKIYDRSYQLRDKMVEIKSDNNSAEVRITHTGDHISYIKGTRFYVPYGLEGGHTWGRGATNIQENSLKKAEDEIPDTYKKAMRSKGIPVK